MIETIEILLVEDDPEDVELTREMLKGMSLSIHLSAVPDGIEALACLRKQGTHAGAKRPDFILLDLNMPLKGGKEVLQEIKADPAIQKIPVIIFTTSSSEKEKEKCLSLGAECFITKPVGLKAFAQTAKQIESFIKSHTSHL